MVLYLEGLNWKLSTEEEMDRTIEEIADWILERKLEAAALLVFQSIKPLAYFGGPMSRIFVAPWFHLVGFNTRHIINTLEEPKNIDKLLDVLEKRMNEK